MDVGGNSRMFSARTEQGAKLFKKELQFRRPPWPGRTRQLVGLAITGVLVAGLLVLAIVAG